MLRALLFLLTTACVESAVAAPEVRSPTTHTVLRGAALPGTTTPVDLRIEAGRITAMGASVSTVDAEVVDLRGRWLAPAIIDSHVHLAYLPVAEDLVRNGIAGAVDLASPSDFLERSLPLALKRTGPMITNTAGYPTQSWGRHGYGQECADGAAAAAAIDELAAKGADLIKLPLDHTFERADALVAVEAAHAKGLKVASHAVSNASASLAVDIGVDVLAHTPTERLADAVVARWKGRAVISTLAAFGGEAIPNLKRLHDAGVTVLYGTDLGNTRDARIQPLELERMMEAGLSGAEILTAATSAPAAWWGFEGLGSLTVGHAAHVLVLDADPHVDPLTLSRPVQVWTP